MTYTCRKSTIINLLLRFYDPRKGSILLDGYDLRSLNIRWLRSIIGVIQQEPVLFNLSVRDNIAYGKLDGTVTDEEIHHVAKIANIHDAIINMPQVSYMYSQTIVRSRTVISLTSIYGFSHLNYLF